MKKFVACVTFEGKLEIIKRDDYSSKKEFEKDLRCNGYRIRFISTEEKFDEDCEKYNEACERNLCIKKSVYEGRKESARLMGMTMKEYFAWRKGN